MMKIAAAAALAGTLAAGVAMPAQAKNGRNTAAAIGFGVGALAGAAIANANNGHYYSALGYYRDCAYEPGYAYGYAAEPGYVYAALAYDAYAYAPAYGLRPNRAPTCTAFHIEAC